MQVGAKDEIKKNKKELAEAERRANSLQDKKVTSIKGQWIDPPTDLGHGSNIKFGVTATLVMAQH